MLLTDPENGKPVEYAFIPTAQYGQGITAETLVSFGELIDRYFDERDHVDRVKQRASDIFKLLTNAEARLNKKIAQQEKELADCAEKESYKKFGDLVTANIWQLQRGMTEAELVDYETEDLSTVKVALDHRLSPSQNAQKYYKRYNKAKNAEIALTEQILLAQEELQADIFHGTVALVDPGTDDGHILCQFFIPTGQGIRGKRDDLLAVGTHLQQFPVQLLQFFLKKVSHINQTFL